MFKHWRKILSIVLLSGLIGNAALADPPFNGDLLLLQYNSGIGLFEQYFVGSGVSQAAAMVINGDTLHPDVFTFGSGIATNTTTKTIVVSDVPIASITGLQTSLNGKASSTHSHVISDVTGLQAALDGKFATPTGTTAQYVRGNGTLATLPVAAAKVFNNGVSRSLNSNYTISSTRDASVSYSINASWTLNALLSGTGSAFLEYSTSSGSTWNTVSQVSKTLNLLTIAGADDMNLTGDVPANALVRIRTTATNMTVTYALGQEVLN